MKRAKIEDVNRKLYLFEMKWKPTGQTKTKTRRKNNYGQELVVGTYGGDTREEADIHAGGEK